MKKKALLFLVAAFVLYMIPGDPTGTANMVRNAVTGVGGKILYCFSQLGTFVRNLIS